MLSALRSLSHHISENGPYDGVIAFSQGACLAATLMLQHQSQDTDSEFGLGDSDEPLFKCAIFLSGILPLDPDALAHGQRKQIGKINAAEAQYCDSGSEDSDSEDQGDWVDAFRIPTAHIWGANDDYPLPQGDRLYKLCPAHLRVAVTHQEGHSIPGKRSEAALKKMVRAVRKTIERADMLH